MNRRTTLFALFILLFLHAPPSIAQEKKRTLLVAPYPGSVAEPYGPPGKGDYPAVPVESRMQTFYSKDSFAKIKAHYEKAVGKFEPANDDAAAHYAAVVPSLDVMNHLIATRTPTFNGSSARRGRT